MIKIFTDSTAYIPEELRKKYNISVINVTLGIGGKEYKETELPNELFYQLVEKNEETVPEIIAPTDEYVKSLFKDETDKGNRILGIFISPKMSEIFSIADRAKKAILKETPDAKIHLIDSETHSMHMGLAVIAAAEANQQGQWLENVAKAAYEVLKRSRYIFTPSKLKYLAQFGNIEKGQAFVGDLVRIRPIISHTKGEVVPMETVRTQKRAIDRMVEILDEDAKKFGLERIVISHINNPGKAMDLKKRLLNRVDGEIYISDIGPSVGYYIGPGTIGIVYQTKDIHPLNEHIVVPKTIS